MNKEVPNLYVKCHILKNYRLKIKTKIKNKWKNNQK